ncbi:MAG: alkaline phosphatase [Deltaproteobacteria bacterium]|nr:alkaline phosphatase [Deltaproteobacteria bacterium]MBN2670574.1 alkaline phosphatase [Deltaproteobacteria bacterium]
MTFSTTKYVGPTAPNSMFISKIRIMALAATLLFAMGCDDPTQKVAELTDVQNAWGSRGFGNQTHTPKNHRHIHKSNKSKPAKYVFYLIGDGMALPQINAAQYYVASKTSSGGVGPNFDAAPVEPPAILNMLTLSAQGFATTHSNNSYITDSAAAGTALACGLKTDSGVISMPPALDAKLPTIAEQAKAKGLKVGIISSVSIDHATPAVFYAHNVSRNNYQEIGMDLVASGFDYFGGGSVRWNKHSDGGAAFIAAAEDAGYTIASNREEIESLRKRDGKVIAYNAVRDSSNAMPFELVRNKAEDADDLSLNDFVVKGIELLNNKRGFFMMVESGKIDWAGHANDAAANIMDTLQFDEVVGTVLDFYEAHADETLIVVTADHETGGMSLGSASMGYNSMFELIDAQTSTYDEYDLELKAMKSDVSNLSDLNETIETTFGFDMNNDGAGIAMSDWDMERLEQAFAFWITGDNEMSAGARARAYDYYNPVVVTLTHILNEKAGIGWTSYSHTAVQVPVYAEGVGAESFNGNYDNTDIYHLTAEAMGL